jgi:hypothetical protein
MGYTPSCLNIFIGRDDDETLRYLMRSNNQKKILKKNSYGTDSSAAMLTAIAVTRSWRLTDYSCDCEKLLPVKCKKLLFHLSCSKHASL